MAELVERLMCLVVVGKGESCTGFGGERPEKRAIGRCARVPPESGMGHTQKR